MAKCERCNLEFSNAEMANTFVCVYCENPDATAGKPESFPVNYEAFEDAIKIMERARIDTVKIKAAFSKVLRIENYIQSEIAAYIETVSAI